MILNMPLTRDMTALVNHEDWSLIEPFSWHACKGKTNRTWYARSNSGGPHETRRHIYMHRLVIGALPGQMVDHINGNSLDNRRCNLRFCTTSQNAGNRVKNRKSAWTYKGVSFEKGAWRARIGRGIGSHLGRFITEAEAAQAYDDAAIERWGEFAFLNFPRRTEAAA